MIICVQIPLHPRLRSTFRTQPTTLQTTEDDYAEALRQIVASESPSVGTSVGTSAWGQHPSLEISAKEKPCKTGALITVDGLGVNHQYTPEQYRPRLFSVFQSV